MSSLSSQLILKKNILTEKSNKLEILNTELLDVIKKQSLNLEINEALIENEIKYINEYLKDKEKSKQNNKSKLGDLNNDSTINVSDVVLTVNLVLSSNYNFAADINSDNTVNVSDIVLLINLILQN